MFTIVLLLSLARVAQADPVWQRSPTPGVVAGLELVTNLGQLTDRKRFGIALNVGAQDFWYEESVGWDGPSPLSPLGRVSAYVGWTPPVVYVQLAAQAGAMYPLQVFDAGMIPLAGVIAGGGLGIASDGWIGPFVATTLIAPFIEGRYDLSLWKKHGHAPRISVGVAVPVVARTEFVLHDRDLDQTAPPFSGTAPGGGPEPAPVTATR